MIRVNLPERVIEVSFAYAGKPPLETSGTIKFQKRLTLTQRRKLPKRATKCRILEVKGRGDTNLIASATVECSRCDVFVKEEGRKKALAKALKNLKLDKWERMKVWMAYSQAIPKSKVLSGIGLMSFIHEEKPTETTPSLKASA